MKKNKVWERIFRRREECKWFVKDPSISGEHCIRPFGVWPFKKGVTKCQGICDKFELKESLE